MSHTPPACVTTAVSEPQGPKVGKRQRGPGAEKLASVGGTVKGADGRGWPFTQEPWTVLCKDPEASSLCPSGVGCWSRDGEDHPEREFSGNPLAGSQDHPQTVSLDILPLLHAPGAGGMAASWVPGPAAD